MHHQLATADAITIHCIALDYKIVIFICANQADVVDIALANKEGNIYRLFIIDLRKFVKMVKRLKNVLTIFPPLCL